MQYGAKVRCAVRAHLIQGASPFPVSKLHLHNNTNINNGDFNSDKLKNQTANTAGRWANLSSIRARTHINACPLTVRISEEACRANAVTAAADST